MTRPFPVRYVKGSAARRLSVEVEWADPIQLPHASTFRPIVSWGEVARLGGMAGETIMPQESSLVMRQPELRADRTVIFHFDEVRIDPRSLLVLENVLHFMHVASAPLVRVSVASDMYETYLTMAEEFPPLYEPVPFQYTYEATDMRAYVEIEFHEDQPQQMLEGVSDRARVWGELSFACGYAEPGALPSAGYLVLDDIERYADMLVLSMQRKNATEFAFDGFVNMLNGDRSRVARVREVRVL